MSRARAATLPAELALRNARLCSGELITCLLETCPDLVSICDVMQHTATHNGSCCSHYFSVGDVSRCGDYSCRQITLDPSDFVGRFAESVKNAMWSMSLPECERALSDVTDQYYKPYILAVGDSARCLYMTLK